MIFFNIPQGDVEWYRARLGVATTSCFDKIITPTGKLSTQADEYQNTLIGEMITGDPAETFKSYWMERGQEFEGQAMSSYQVITDFELDRGGFFTNDAMTLGASPDVRVLREKIVVGGGEIKCPAPKTHIANSLRDAAIDPAYKPQVQGQMYICEFEFVDWISYHPSMPPQIIRTYRDEQYIATMADALDRFVDTMNEKMEKLKAKGFVIPERPVMQMHRNMQLAAEDMPEFMMAG